MATATRPRIVCAHTSPACCVSLVDAQGVTVGGPLWITNPGVVELIRVELVYGPTPELGAPEAARGGDVQPIPAARVPAARITTMTTTQADPESAPL